MLDSRRRGAFQDLVRIAIVKKGAVQSLADQGRSIAIPRQILMHKVIKRCLTLIRNERIRNLGEIKESFDSEVGV